MDFDPQAENKFILTNMALVSLVLIVVFAVLMGSTSQRLAGQSLAAMRMSLEWGDDRDPPRFEFSPSSDMVPDKWADRGGGTFQQVMMIPVFCVSLTEDNQVDAVYAQDSVSVSDQVLEEAVSQALDSGTHEGILTKLGLRYLVETSPEGETRIAFADRSWERENLRGLLLTSLLVGMGPCWAFSSSACFSPSWPPGRWKRPGSSSANSWPTPPTS